MQQNIDQLFKSGVDGLSSTPAGMERNPEMTWGKLERLLEDQPKRRAGAWIWLGAAASIALLLGLIWVLQKPQPFAPLQPQPNVALITQPDTVATCYEVTSDNLSQTFEVVAWNDEYGYASYTPSFSYAPDQAISAVQIYENRNLDMNTYGSISGSYNYAEIKNISAMDIRSIKKGKGHKSPKSQVTRKMAAQKNHTQEKAPKMSHLQRKMTRKLLRQEGRPKGIKRLFTKRPIETERAHLDPYTLEYYATTIENTFQSVANEPQSTFSIDVDRAAYTNHRRFVENSQLPPKYSVRVEEYINYFHYDYAPPTNDDPFSILPEVTSCPWNPSHKIARIAIKGHEVSLANMPAANVVFLLDVSGSMSAANKLPLLKTALTMLAEQLREQDKVSIVVYAGAAGLVLPATSGNNKEAILQALNALQAGGSTAGGQGIELAYAVAKENFVKGGNNRVVLATDGDFNVGVYSDQGLEELIVRKREEGVFLSVLGFGDGNLQDAKMELLADKGNGNYNYIDNQSEAKKVLVTEFGGTMLTIAKDVKIQLEFNPAEVAGYRLIGYENRKLKNEDFANDKIDAGELGAGHTVTALYELIPAQAQTGAKHQELKYQSQPTGKAAHAGELLTVKLRYKAPDGNTSKLLEQVLHDDGRSISQATNDFRWAVAIAEYGLLLRQSEFAGTASFEQVLELAQSALGPDTQGYRREFIGLLKRVMLLQQNAQLQDQTR